MNLHLAYIEGGIWWSCLLIDIVYAGAFADGCHSHRQIVTTSIVMQALVHGCISFCVINYHCVYDCGHYYSYSYTLFFTSLCF